jgi:hypothetical protein
MPNLPATRPSDLDELLRDHMQDIIALIEAIAAGEADCDIKLAELLEGATEQVRIAIVEKLREMIRERAQEKEQELDKHLEAQKRVEVTRQRNMFMQWLTWIMSEETLRKLRMAFLARPALEGHVKDIGQDLANYGLQTQLADKRDLGGMAANVTQVQGQGKGADKGRQ